MKEEVTWLVPRETAAFSACSVCTIQPCTMSHHSMQSHICRVHACYCFGVTCHLHFWQNDRDFIFIFFTCHCGNTGVERIPNLHFWQNDRDFFILIFLRATAVTRGWNGYRNKSQYRKLILEKKILPLLLSVLEPATFPSRIRSLTTELSPLPILYVHNSLISQLSYAATLKCSANVSENDTNL